MVGARGKVMTQHVLRSSCSWLQFPGVLQPDEPVTIHGQSMGLACVWVDLSMAYGVLIHSFNRSPLEVSVRAWKVFLAVAAVAACSGEDKMREGLREDLALASNSDALTLASATAQPVNPGVVAAVEQTAPQKRAPAASRRAPRPKPAVAPPIPAAVEPDPVQVSEEVQVAAAEPAPAPTTGDGLSGSGDFQTPASRPAPVESRGGSGTVSSRGGGPDLGSILAGIGIAVIRGGVVGPDRCDPRTDGRRPVGTRPVWDVPVARATPRGGNGGEGSSTVSINERIPTRTTPPSGDSRGMSVGGAGGAGRSLATGGGGGNPAIAR